MTFKHTRYLEASFFLYIIYTNSKLPKFRQKISEARYIYILGVSFTKINSFFKSKPRKYKRNFDMNKTLLIIFFLSFFMQNLFSQSVNFASNINLNFVKPEQTFLTEDITGMPAPLPELLAKINFTVSDFENTDKIEIILENTNGIKYIESFCSIKKENNKFYLFYNDEFKELNNNNLYFEFPIDKNAENETKTLTLKFYKNMVLQSEQIKK